MTEKYEIYETAWCPGCGNYPILTTLQSVLDDLQLDKRKLVIAGGIGQAAKTPQYIDCNAFCGLHGREIPAAAAIKIANEDLTVLVHTGEGGSYGEGGNHFLHNIRRNVDITHVAHDNQIYGLTKGQASPTSDLGMKTKIQPEGVFQTPFDPILLALSAGCGFVARASAADTKQLGDILKAAIAYKGYSLIDVFQPCVVWNKKNTFAWYREHTYTISEEHDATDYKAAMLLAMEKSDTIPLGIFYNVERPTYNELHPALHEQAPLVTRLRESHVLEEIMDSYM